MKLRLFFIFLLALFSMTAYAEQVAVEDLFTTVTTLSEVKQKLKLAKANHKPVMLEFYASWCPACKALDRNVFSGEEMQKRMNSFDAIRVDITQQNENSDMLVSYFNVYGTPTFIFYDSKGKKVQSDKFSNGVNGVLLFEMLDVVEKT